MQKLLTCVKHSFSYQLIPFPEHLQTVPGVQMKVLLPTSYIMYTGFKPQYALTLSQFMRPLVTSTTQVFTLKPYGFASKRAGNITHIAHLLRFPRDRNPHMFMLRSEGYSPKSMMDHGSWVPGNVSELIKLRHAQKQGKSNPTNSILRSVSGPPTKHDL